MTHKKAKVLWCFLFILIAALALSAMALAAEDETERVIVLYEDNADPAEIASSIGQVEGVELLWTYDTFFSGAAVDAVPRALERLEALPGVAGVRPARTYEEAPASAGENGDLTAVEGLTLMNADKLWEQGYTGDGVVIAVLDTGLRTGHEAFADDSLMTAPALSRDSVEAFIAKGHTAGRYVSTRIPFAYDYYSRDDDVSTTQDHGTHVTALAAGYAQDKDGSVLFRGGAPGAQILSMKIFPDNLSSGTDDSIILRALEDAWNLGADIVNLSVGIGPGFVQDPTLDGIYYKAYTVMAESGVIICCAAGNENTVSATKSWEPKLPTAAYTDYGSNCSPASYRGAAAIGAAAFQDGRAVPAEYSSWGPASGLHLTPALTAFGGPSVSASITGDSAYRNHSGTSMASGSVSGMFATLLEVLRERGVTDKVQAAQLAQNLLECTAQVLKSEDGIPFSPRKQGAGLADLSAAASSGLVITAPILELGESGEGEFTLSFTLRNLGKKTVAVALSVTTLTDAYEKRGDIYYSTLTSRDISGSVTVEGDKSVTVPAGGEAEVKLTLAVNSALRQELAEVFPNGFYVEGFVTVSGGGQAVHGTFMGYCGDWEAAPVLEPLDFRNVQDAWFRMAGDDRTEPNTYLTELKADLGANLAFCSDSQAGLMVNGRLLGANAHAYALHDDARLAMPSQDTNAAITPGGWLRLDLYAQRNAAGIVFLVSDQATGEVYYASGKTWLERSVLSGKGGDVRPAASFAWDGTDAKGKPLPGGTKVQADVYAWLDTDTDAVAACLENSGYDWLLEDSYAEYRELSFPLTMDGQAPTVSAALSGDGTSLTLTFRDDQYLAYAAVSSQQGELLEEKVFFPAAAGESGTLTIPFPARPGVLHLQAEDYAGNAAGYILDGKALAAGETVSPEWCASVLLLDVEPGAWYHDAVDYVLDHGIMETDGHLEFSPEARAVRAEIAMALYQAYGKPALKTDPYALPFQDVSGMEVYAAAVCWACENELVEGVTGNVFAVNASVSRQDLAAMLWRCAKWSGSLGSAGGSLDGFSDRGDVADWAVDAMTWAVGQGLINGDGGKLDPEGRVTRAQAAQILMRFLER